MQAQTHTYTHTPRHMQLSSSFEPTCRITSFPSILSVQWSISLLYMTIYNICEHNLEAHFLCNRTGALCQAEWSSHLRKTQDTIFSKQWLKSIRRLSLHTVMYKHTCRHTVADEQIHLLYRNTHNFKESFPQTLSQNFHPD